MLAPAWMDGAPHAFGSVLIANRGEVACRIARACRELGLSTVAIHTSEDGSAPLLDLCDQRFLLEGEGLSQTYLSIEAILAAAELTGAQAIHPGFGFLAESAGFAEAVEQRGLVWIGPSPNAIRVMGDKMTARRAMRAAGISLVPGSEVSSTDPAVIHSEVMAAAGEMGFPVLLKATAGGGGKGMRVVERPADLAAAIQSATREAQAAFGDGRIYVERLLSGCRHVEIQILADGHGNIVHLGERECSLQRRHQKVIEECPSPVLGNRLRMRMGAAAITAAAAVTYMGAGTVEFLLEDDEFHFLEMNTRLQVEHPVTEMVTGVDIVHQQLRIAAGLPLDFTQADVSMRGHSIEARIYAEDPGAGFLPAAGPLLMMRMPSGPGIRVDTGVAEGGEVSTSFDPMIAKLIVHASDRPTAIRRMRTALRETVMLGLRTNIEFLAALLEDEDVAEGHTTTDLIESKWPGGWTPPDDERTTALAVIACAAARSPKRTGDLLGGGSAESQPDPFTTLSGRYP